MNLIYVFWGILAALGTSFWAIILSKVSPDILSDFKSKITYIRLVFIVAGILSFLTFLLPKYNWNEINILNKIKKNINIKTLILVSTCLLFYQMCIIYAISIGGPLAQILINFNVFFIFLYISINSKSKFNFKLAFLTILYVLIGMYIIYSNSKITTR